MGSVCPQEAESFAKSAALDTHKALVHIFFAQRTTKKVRALAAHVHTFFAACASLWRGCQRVTCQMRRCCR